MSPNVASFALSIAERVIVQPWLWFSHLLTSSGMTGTFLAALAMFLAFKFLVAPIMGVVSSPSSDTAKKRKKKGD